MKSAAFSVAHELALAVFADQVFDDGAGFRDRRAAVGDDRRFAEGMNLLQFIGREVARRVALVAGDLIVQAEFLQQPEDTLGARIVEVVDSDHGGLALCRLRRNVGFYCARSA